jgi:hypothetical protein
MTKFDLNKTREVEELFATSRERRDLAWRERFYAALPDASMATTPDQVMRGPDGFTYFVLSLPPAGQPFETFCISHILDLCLERGAGIVVQPEPSPPQWVFPYGLLWSHKEFGEFVLEGDDGEDRAGETTTAPGGSEAGQNVLAGQASAAFFPSYARKIIKQFLVDKAGIAAPEVMLVNDPSGVPGQSLAFNVFLDDFEQQQDFENVMYRLTWFLPRHYGLISIARESELAKTFAPL